MLQMSCQEIKYNVVEMEGLKTVVSECKCKAEYKNCVPRERVDIIYKFLTFITFITWIFLLTWKITNEMAFFQ